MNFNMNSNLPMAALLGAGSMGCAIIRRIGAGKTILLGDISEKNLEARAAELRTSGYVVETCVVDAMDRDSVRAFAEKAASLGEVKYFIDTAGASPNQSSPEHIAALDLVATSYAIDEFAGVIARGGAGLVVSSQAGYMMDFTPEVEKQLALTPTEELADTSTIFTPAQIDMGKRLKVGKRVFINRNFTAMAIGGITIGDGTMIGPNVTVVTDNHDFQNRMVLLCHPVHIGKNVWIGACASIMPGVTIGDNAVIAGGAVVVKDVEANTVVGGNPARVIKRL